MGNLLMFSFCILFLLLSGCTSQNSNLHSKEDIKLITIEDKDVEIKEEMKYLNNSSTISYSNVPYDLVKGFVPNENYIKKLPVKDDKLTLLTINDQTATI